MKLLKEMGFLKKINIILVLEIGLLLFTTFYNFKLFNTVKIVGNGASRALTAIGPLLNIGAPYKDLYEFAPPGYFMMVGAWSNIFGISMISFRSLHALLILLHGVCVLLICKKLFSSKFLSLIIFSFTILVAHSRLVQSDIFSVDLAATAFALAGLTVILYIKNIFLKLSLSSAFMLIAFQMKDIYLLTLITLIPLYIREFINKDELKFYKTLLISLIGPLVVIGSVAIYLHIYEIFPSYIEVFKDKMGVARHYLSWLDFYESNKVIVTHFDKFFVQNSIVLGGTLIVLNTILWTANLLYKIIKIKKWYEPFIKLITSIHRLLNNYGETIPGARSATVLFALSLLGGLTLYGQYSVDTRFIPITTCLYILLGILISIPFNILYKHTNSRFLKIVFFLFISVLIFPKKEVVGEFIKPFPNPTAYNFEAEHEIMSRTMPNDCILHIYGWEVSSTYIYTDRRPCTKYFLINHLTLFGKRRISQEYRDQIFANPPKALIINRLGADFDITAFEKNVLNIPSITNHCYVLDNKYHEYKGNFFAPVNIYWPKENLTEEKLKDCVSKYGRV